ncbi:MAG TPA: hypothetical protein VIH17_04755 [Candidatus Acidoferrales bacterium]
MAWGLHNIRPGEASNEGRREAMGDEKGSCMKCGATEDLRPDPNIEGMYFCGECWKEREKLEWAQKHGYADEFQDEDG